jgi:hypothetical protein
VFDWDITKVKRINAGTNACRNSVAATQAVWDQAAKLFGHPNGDWYYYTYGSATPSHLVVFENRTGECGSDMGYWGLADVGDPELATSNGGEILIRVADRPGTWTDGYDLESLTHEMGHNLSWTHSDKMTCEAKNPKANLWDEGNFENCVSREYSDTWENMGGLAAGRVIGPVRKFQMGLLEASARTALVSAKDGKQKTITLTLTAGPNRSHTDMQALVVSTAGGCQAGDPLPVNYIKVNTLYYTPYCDYGFEARTNGGDVIGVAVMRTSREGTALIAKAGEPSTIYMRPGDTFVSHDDLLTVKVSKMSGQTATLQVTYRQLTAKVDKVQISGTAKTGQKLTAKAEATPAGAAIAYQWLRDGQAISGATAASYAVAAADVGHKLSVRATASKSGYDPASATSAQVKAEAGRLEVTKVAVTPDQAAVGTLLTAKATTGAPAAAVVTYQWLRAGKAISGATGATYRVTEADKGKAVTCKATVSATGYNSASGTSAGVVPDLVALHQFTAKATGSRFYTTSEAERTKVARAGAHTYDGVIGYVPAGHIAGAGEAAVHRFYNLATGTHFFTASADEVAAVKKNKSYRYEGVAFVVPTSGSGTVEVRRFYQAATGTHLFTAQSAEAAKATAKQAGAAPYAAEGVAFRIVAAATLEAADPNNALHRFYNSTTGAHFYTASDSEMRAVLANTAFAYEGVVGRVPDKTKAGSGEAAVYRFYNPVTGAHFFTASESEKAAVLKNYKDFKYEGVAYVAFTSADSGALAVYRFFNSQTGAHFFTTDSAEADKVKRTLKQFSFEGIAYYIGR